jgi:hypothetical protein
MVDHSIELLATVREIRLLLELLAEPAIAQRDAKLRAELLKIVGSSKVHRKVVFLLDGVHTQKDIRDKTSAHSGNLSTFIGKLKEAKLLTGDSKTPKLAISIPANFFESADKET